MKTQNDRDLERVLNRLPRPEAESCRQWIREPKPVIYPEPVKRTEGCGAIAWPVWIGLGLFVVAYVFWGVILLGFLRDRRMR